jgi:hypothetical protein
MKQILFKKFLSYLSDLAIYLPSYLPIFETGVSTVLPRLVSNLFVIILPQLNS